MSHKVLFVDDEPNVTRSLKHMLRREAYEIFSAGDAKEALRILAKEEIDVVVSDEQMPGMSGTKLLSVVRADFPDTVRIIMTGHARLETAVTAINEGEIYRFLIKPCNGLDLAITIRQALQHKQLIAKSRQLLRVARRQFTLLQELERKHPGITRIDKGPQGALILEAPIESFDVLIQKIDAEIQRAECRLAAEPAGQG
ncbi:MAG: response regulator [Sedimentisphaerales bacterium]|nr:response regulator [Sedimentisphaerales bacterium]